MSRMIRMRAQTASVDLETLDHYDHWRWGIMCFSSIQCWLVLIGWVLLSSLGGNFLDVEMCQDNPGLLCDATRISTVFLRFPHILIVFSSFCLHWAIFAPHLPCSCRGTASPWSLSTPGPAEAPPIHDVEDFCCFGFGFRMLWVYLGPSHNIEYI